MGASLSRRALPPLLVFGLLAAISNLPYLRAQALPPSGSRFLGVFYSIPDVYNYFSYMQQAEDGAFLFVNKLVLEPQRPAFVNLEWWAVGWLSAHTGIGLPWAFRVLGLVSSLFLILGVDRWLRAAGLPDGHRLGALLLVFLGGGLGGLCFLCWGPPAWRFLDLTTGLFPFISIVVNPHFVTGTALLVWAALALNRGGAGTPLGLVLGNILGLVRPYDVVLLVAIRLASLAAGGRGAFLRGLPWLAGLLPAALFNYWALYVNPSFRMLSSFKYVVGDLGGYALALAPMLALAAPGMLVAFRGSGETRVARVALLAWVLMVGAIVTVLAVPFSFLIQGVVNLGVPLAALAALGLARRPPQALLLAAALYSSTGLVALKLLLEDNPTWFVPRERLAAAEALKPFCHPGDIVMAPPEMGLYANALSACRAFVTHVIAPDTAERREEMTRFYVVGAAAERRALLDRRCVTHVLLSGDQGRSMERFLGPESSFERLAVVGRDRERFSLYGRKRPPSCLPGALP